MSLPTLTPASTVSAIVLPVTGTSTEVNSLVPYKIYSDSTAPLYSVDFLSGAAEQVAYVYKKLGGDVLDIELTTGNIYAAYEEACLEYSYIINVHQAGNVLSNVLGDMTGTFDHKGQLKTGELSSSLGGSHVALKLPRFVYGMSKKIMQGTSEVLGLGESVEYSASFDVEAGKQDYDLQEIITNQSDKKASGSVTITNIANLSATDNDSVTVVTTDNTSVVASVSATTTTTDDRDNPTFQLGANVTEAANNLATCLNANSKLIATAQNGVVTITQFTAGAGGNTTIALSDANDAGMSKVDFQGGATGFFNLEGKKVTIKKVFYKTPHAMWRFYGYYGGLNVVGNLSNYGQFSDSSTFQLVPTWQNKSQAMAFEDAIYTRLSHYSFELKDNKLRIFPEPMTNQTNKMWVQFSVPTDSYLKSGTNDHEIDGVNNLNTVPFGNLPYSNINSIGKQWIRRFALALSKEILGQVRSKFGAVPIPGESITLNGSDLISQAREEQDKLREELKTTLAELTYSRLSEIEAGMSETAERAVAKTPVNIFVG